VILAYMVLVIVMGTVLDSPSIMLILVPLMLPVLVLAFPVLATGLI